MFARSYETNCTPVQGKELIRNWGPMSSLSFHLYLQAYIEKPSVFGQLSWIGCNKKRPLKV